MKLVLLTFQYLVLTASYVGLALGYLPGLRMNRATIALAGSALLVSSGLLSVEEAWQAIDATTIVFLLSMMIVNANLAYSGFFRMALARLTQITRSPFGLVTLLTFGSGILSAFFLNDTIAIIFTPLTLSLTQAVRINPIPYLLAVASATNLGSVATISGNPQNILIGSFSHISYLAFAQALTPVALMGLVIQVGLLALLYPEVRSLKPAAGDPAISAWIYKPLFAKTLLISIVLLMSFVVGVPLAEAAFVAAALLLITRRIKPERVLREVDWNLLVMFSGLFVLTRCTEALNLLHLFTGWVDSAGGLTIVTVILSNLISNVPAVLLLQPLIPPADSRAWLLLAASSTLAGNLTLFGSVANLIVAEAAGKQGYRLTFLDHLRFGLPLTLLTLAIAFLWLR
ncbi:anion transporter [Phormidium tenue FACHB-886]|nr:anion transporter [Phormidium tenue FACHB-886]